MASEQSVTTVTEVSGRYDQSHQPRKEPQLPKTEVDTTGTEASIGMYKPFTARKESAERGEGRAVVTCREGTLCIREGAIAIVGVESAHDPLQEGAGCHQWGKATHSKASWERRLCLLHSVSDDRNGKSNGAQIAES